MGLRDDITADIAESFDSDLADAVTAFTGTRQTGQGTWDPVNETWIPGNLAYDGRGVFGSYSAELADGINILRTDVRLTALQAEVTEDGNPIAPNVDDVIAGMKVVHVSQDPAGASWSVQLRKL